MTDCDVESADEKTLFSNLEGCLRALQIISDYHPFLPPAVCKYLTDLFQGIEFCTSLSIGNPKKLYNIILDRLYQLKSECHLPLKLYFNHSSPYWEYYRLNVMEIRAVLTCCCSIPKLPIQRFQRKFVDFDKILGRHKWGKFQPDEMAVERFLAHLRAERRRKKLQRMLVDDEPSPEDQTPSSLEPDRNPLTLVKQDSNYFSLRIGAKSVSGAKKRGPKTLPGQSSRRQSLMSLRNSLQRMRPGAFSKTSTSGEFTGIKIDEEEQDYF